MMNNFLNGMFGKVGNGMCRLSMSGGIAVKTANGYKSYNVKTGKLTNCSNFVFDIGEDFFFVIPTSSSTCLIFIFIPSLLFRHFLKICLRCFFVCTLFIRLP